MNFCRQLEPTLFNSSLAFCTTVYGDQKSAKYGGKFAKILGPLVWSWYLFLDMKNIWFAGIFGPLSCTFLIMSAAQEKGSMDRLFWCTGCKFGLLPFIDLFQSCKNVQTVRTSRCYFFWPVLIFGKSMRKTGENTRKQAKNRRFFGANFFGGKIGWC